jgi:hypothetical protein
MKKILFILVLLLMCSQLFASKFHKGDIVIPIRYKWFGLACVVNNVYAVYKNPMDEDEGILYYRYDVTRIEDTRWKYRNENLDGEYNKDFTAEDIISYFEFLEEE